MHFYLRINGRIKTGGPKAMYQLAQSFSNLGHDVTVVYDDEESYNFFLDWHVGFLNRGDNFVLSCDIGKIKHAFYVTTETAVSEIHYLDNTITVWLYMLSVDNCLIFGINPKTIEAKIRHLKNKFKYLPSSYKNRWRVISKKISLVLSQSAYANDFLSAAKPGVSYYYIGDYIDVKCSSYKIIDDSLKNRKLQIAYNPAKGKLLFFLCKLLSGRNINFVPVKGISPEDLPSFFNKVDAYVDFGGQPGKDRLPREALLSGIPSFQFMRGAAINGSDFPCTSLFRLHYRHLFEFESHLRNVVCNYSKIMHFVRVSEIVAERELFDVRIKNLLKTVLEEVAYA